MANLAPGCQDSPRFDPVPENADADWAFLDSVTHAHWNMPLSAAEMNSVMSPSVASSGTADARMGKLEKQMSIMMRMMITLMRRNRSSSSSRRGISSSRSSTPGSNDSASKTAACAQLFRCPVCISDPMTEKSFYKHIRRLKTTAEGNCRFESADHLLLRKYSGDVTTRGVSFCDDILRLLNPGSMGAHSAAGSGNDVRVTAFLDTLLSK